MDSFRDFLKKFWTNKRVDSNQTPDESAETTQTQSKTRNAYPLESAAGVLYRHKAGQKHSTKALVEALKIIEDAGKPMHVTLVTAYCVHPELAVRKQAWNAVEALLRHSPDNLKT